MILLYKPTLLCFMILVVQAQRNTEESNRLRGLVSDNSVVVSDMRVFPMYDAGSTDDDWSDDDMSSGKGKKSSNGKGKGKDSYSKSSGEEYSKSSAKGSAKGGSSGKASKRVNTVERPRMTAHLARVGKPVRKAIRRPMTAEYATAERIVELIIRNDDFVYVIQLTNCTIPNVISRRHGLLIPLSSLRLALVVLHSLFSFMDGQSSCFISMYNLCICSL